MSRLRPVDVFTPSDFPTYTYVKRAEERLEKRLREALQTPGEIVSVSGPSKSGKTVLVERVVGRDNLISVTGAGLNSADALWDRVLNWMGTPNVAADSVAWQASGGITGGGSGGLAIPGVAEAKANAQASANLGRTSTHTKTTHRSGMQQVIDEIAKSDFVLLIDDFHYMQRDIQSEVAKQMKDAARQGVKICTASVPHRADDVVRANPELRGRLRIVDIDYWTPAELEQIATLGYQKLNARIPTTLVARFATEASGSPQLMQALCLQTCFELKIPGTLEDLTSYVLEEARVVNVFEETASRTDFGSLLRKMHTGPKTRGQERKVFKFSDGSRGDVYRCVLLAMSASPPQLSFNYNNLSGRIQLVSQQEQPHAASIYQALAQISEMATSMYPNERVVEWDDNDSLFDIVDPYFLYYLRWSGRMAKLESEG